MKEEPQGRNPNNLFIYYKLIYLSYNPFILIIIEKNKRYKKTIVYTIDCLQSLLKTNIFYKSNYHHTPVIVKPKKQEVNPK